MPRSVAAAGRHPVSHLAVLAAAGLAVIAVVVGAAASRERRTATENWRARLEAVADDREEALDRWLSDGLADAAVVASYPTTRYALGRRRGRPFPFPVEQGPEGHLSELLKNVRDAHGYGDAYVARADGHVVAGSAGTAVPARCLEVARAGLAAPGPLAIVHRHDDGSVAVAFVAPVSGVAPSPSGVAEGTAVLEVSAAAWLFPLLTRLPFPSRTAETVLMSREEDEVRFLSPLRHDPSPPLTLTRPVAGRGFAAAFALAGRETFGSFVDYRGARVLAVTRKLDTAPWGLVVKVDWDEAMAQVRGEMSFLALASAGLYAALAAVAYALWQRQRSRYLREEEESLRKLSRAVEQSPASVLMTDLSGAIEYVNPRFTEVTGYTLDEVLGQNPRLLKSGQVPSETYADLWRTITAGKEWRGELINRRRNGELFWESASISPIVDATGRITHFVAVKEDITERKRAEQVLAQTREQLYWSQKIEAVGRLAGAVAHDFNNLLSVITGYGEMLARSLPGEGTARGRIDQILKAAGRAAALTRQLLAFSRRQVLSPKVVDLSEVVRDVEKMLRRVIGEDVELAVSLAPGLGSVLVDPGQIEQVLMNLAVNARDAMPSGGVLKIETANADLDAAYAATHEPVQPGPYVLLAVSDSGVGMDEATRSHVFEPFFTTKPPGEGTGLGLSTVYGIVKQSGGYVWVYSEPGRGTTFKIYLPRVDEAPAPRPAARPETPPSSRGETILLVEDQPALREMVRESLESLGYVVLEAEGGEQALDIARRHAGPIDLLITDVVMPRMSGRAVAEAIAASRPATRVLYCSGHPSEIVARHGLLEPGVHLLEKPFTIAALAGRVREVLGTGQ